MLYYNKMNRKIVSFILLSNVVYFLSNYVTCEILVGNMKDNHNCIKDAKHIG